MFGFFINTQILIILNGNHIDKRSEIVKNYYFKKVKAIVIVILIIIEIAFSQNRAFLLHLNSIGSTENKPTQLYKNMVFLGTNYSQFTTTDGIGKIGLNFGYYRQSRIWKQFYLNYGIMYTNKKLDLINKKIRWSDVHYYCERTDIHLNYNILELNLMGSYSFRLTENIIISPVIGIGYGAFFYPKSKIGASELIYQNEPVEDYDYRMAFTDGPLIFFNSQSIYHCGIKASIEKYYMMLNYTNYPETLESIGSIDLVLNEKINSFNILLGIYF